MSPRLKLSTRYGLNTALLIALALGIIVIVDIISYRHNWKKDLTTNKRHSLSEQTLNVIKGLKEPVKVTAFMGKGSPAYEEAQELFDLYTYHSKFLKVSLVDPDLNPEIARQEEIGRYGIPVVFFRTEKGHETVTQIDEEQVTNALIKVTRAEKKKVYFVNGHGEHSLDDPEQNGLTVIKKMMEDKNYRVEPLILIRAEAVPADCAILVVAGPQSDLAESELKTIEQYISGGGRVLFLIDPQTAPSLKPFLDKYGIELGNDIIVDQNRLFGGASLTPVLTAYTPSHPITRNFNVFSIFVLARSVSTREVSGYQTTWLAKAGDGSWAETDLSAIDKGKASFEPGKDTLGPITLAAASEAAFSGNEEETAKQSKGAVVVFGDSDFVTNGKANFFGNSQLFMNSINWLAQEELLIAIPPKESSFQPLLLTATDARMLFVLPVIVLPGLVLISGIYVFTRRSKHS